MIRGIVKRFTPADTENHPLCYNFSMPPNNVYFVDEMLPEYGLAIHLDFEEGKYNGPIIQSEYEIR